MWSGKCPVGEMSVRGNVLVGKCPVGKLSFGEVSGRGNVCRGSVSQGIVLGELSVGELSAYHFNRAYNSSLLNCFDNFIAIFLVKVKFLMLKLPHASPLVRCQVLQ